MAKSSNITKSPGRPAGAANRGNEFVRNTTLNTRISEGANQVLQCLVEQGTYKSKTDAIHDAIQQLGLRKLTDKKSKYWLTQI